MKIIPVIDVLGGLAVHAVRGERQNYKPIKSVLCNSADPIEVSKTFRSLGFSEIYLADLDAIMGGARSRGLYRRIKDETGLKLMVDSGAFDAQSAYESINEGADIAVIGTETLKSLEALSDAVKALGQERIIVSFDIKGGRFISRSPEVAELKPLQLAKRLEDMGVSQILLLDMDRIGTGCGVNLILLEALVSGTRLKVMVGGGVSSLKELYAIRDIGAYGVLLATALHRGIIKPEELKASGLL